MNIKNPITKVAVTAAITCTSVMGTLGLYPAVAPIQTAAASSTSYANSDTQHAVETLNSFYKPALKGQFPGNASLFTIGKSTRQDVAEVMGEPDVKGEDADAFDMYSANMGNPGYAFSYKLNKIREMRYFGTNVESQTNIGGITISMLWQQWYAPYSSTFIYSGKTQQIKVTYIRGDYQLDFIFNNKTDLDHINLTRKS